MEHMEREDNKEDIHGWLVQRREDSEDNDARRT